MAFSYLLRNLQNILRTLKPLPGDPEFTDPNRSHTGSAIGGIHMNKQVLQTSVMFAVLFGATLTNASAQESPGLEGPWIANVTVHNCDTGDVIRTVRELATFGHDGSFTQAGATITGSA